MKYEKNRAIGTSLAMGLLMFVGYGRHTLSECLVVVASFFTINTRL